MMGLNLKTQMHDVRPLTVEQEEEILAEQAAREYYEDPLLQLPDDLVQAASDFNTYHETRSTKLYGRQLMSKVIGLARKLEVHSETIRASRGTTLHGSQTHKEYAEALTQSAGRAMLASLHEATADLTETLNGIQKVSKIHMSPPLESLLENLAKMGILKLPDEPVRETHRLPRRVIDALGGTQALPNPLSEDQQLRSEVLEEAIQLLERFTPYFTQLTTYKIY